MQVNLQTSIRPEDIDVKKHFFGAFGHMETEISAGYIIGLLQEKGQGWTTFTRPEIETFYNKNRYPSKEHVELFYREVLNRGTNDTYLFNRLIAKGWILQKEGVFEVTEDFINRCYKAAPKGNKHD